MAGPPRKYRSSAEYYLAGRLPYPKRLAEALHERLGLDCQGRLLDLGCGPGALTLLLAPSFREVMAVDADAGMIRVGEAETTQRGMKNVTWLHAYAEDIGDVGTFDAVTLAQSFHRMDQPVVAARIRRYLKRGGYCDHVAATTHEGAGDVGACRIRYRLGSACRS